MPLMCMGAEVKACPSNPEHTHTQSFILCCLFRRKKARVFVNGGAFLFPIDTFTNILRITSSLLTTPLVKRGGNKNMFLAHFYHIKYS